MGGGGGGYDRDTYSSSYDDSYYSGGGGGSSSSSRSTRSSSSGFAHSATAARDLSRQTLDPALLPLNRRLVCRTKQGVIIGVDLTGSMGNSVKTIYDKLPMLWGQLGEQAYLEEYSLAFMGVGDIHSDTAPLQFCEFAQSSAIDTWVKKIFVEGNGGSNAGESYEMLAYYATHYVDFEHPEAEKPFIFIIGDEVPYKRVTKEELAKHFGPVQAGATVEEIFRDLQSQYHAFYLQVGYGGGSLTSAHSRDFTDEWRRYLGDHVLALEEPKSVVDVILGVIALTRGVRTLESYLDDMKAREQTEHRLDVVARALQPLVREVAPAAAPVAGTLDALTTPAAPVRTAPRRRGRRQE